MTGKVSEVKTLAELLADPAAAAQPALLFDEQVYTYADLDAASNQAAQALIGHGVRPGETVCQVVGNRPELIINLFGIVKCGAIYAPLNPSLTERELAAQFADCRASLAIADTELVGRKVELALAALPRCRVLPVTELSAQLRDGVPPPSLPTDPDSPAVLCYTSGTAGRAKGVQLTHRNILTNARQVLARTGLTPEDRLLVIMPIFHANGLCNQVVMPFMGGASIVLQRRFVLDEFWPAVARYRPTYFTAVPTILSRLLEGPEPPPQARRSSLRFVRTGAAPLSIEVQQRFEERFELPVIVSYGLTEATCTVTMNPPTLEGRKLGSVGMALDGLNVRVVDTHGKEQPVGTVGEIATQGPSVMLGYLGLPNETAEAIPDGWLRTGDLGYVDEDGYLFLTDRKKDLIIRGGENISPREIEEVLYAHAMVAEAAVLGLADPVYGEQVAAFVVLRDQSRCQADVVEELLAHCRIRLARFKVPAHIEVLHDMPKNAVGKIAKRELGERSAFGSGQTRRLGNVHGMSASPVTPDVSPRRSEPTR